MSGPALTLPRLLSATFTQALLTEKPSPLRPGFFLSATCGLSFQRYSSAESPTRCGKLLLGEVHRRRAHVKGYSSLFRQSLANSSVVSLLQLCVAVTLKVC